MKPISFTILVSMSYAASVDCPTLITFAQLLGIQSAQPAIWIALQEDCCIANGVTCVGQIVTEIKWSHKGLNGTIDGTSLTAGVTLLDLNNNQIYGSIPEILPSGLTYLDLAGNDLSGSIPKLLPAGLTKLCLHLNRMSGDLPVFPITVDILYLGYPESSPVNHFTGTLKLRAPYFMHIADNWITDVIIEDSSNFLSCGLHNNPLLGNPNIVGLTRCDKTGLYSANLLPNTLITSKIATTNDNFTSSRTLSSDGILLSATSSEAITKFDWKIGFLNLCD